MPQPDPAGTHVAWHPALRRGQPDDPLSVGSHPLRDQQPIEPVEIVGREETLQVRDEPEVATRPYVVARPHPLARPSPVPPEHGRGLAARARPRIRRERLQIPGGDDGAMGTSVRELRDSQRRQHTGRQRSPVRDEASDRRAPRT